MFQGIFKSAIKMPDTNTNYIFGAGSIPIQIKTAQLATFADGTTKQQGYQVAEVNKLISTMLTGWDKDGNKPKSMSDNYLELILSCDNGFVVKKRLQFPHIIAWQNDDTPYNIADVYKEFSVDNWLKADDFENPDITLVVEPTDEILTTSTATPPEATTTNSGRFYLYYRNLPVGVNRVHIEFHIKTKTEPIDFDLEVIDGLSLRDAQIILASNEQAKINVLLSNAKDVYKFTGAEGNFGEITMHEWSALYQQIISLKPSNKFTHDLYFYVYDESEINTKLTDLEQQVIYDVTANNDGVTFDSLSALLSSNNLSTLIPFEVRCGGMSIRFVQSSDNKYVQYRLMSNSFNTNVANWQGVDDKPTAGSENLVKSGGVAELNDKKMDKIYPIYETSPITATDTQYQTDYYIDYYGNIKSTSGFGVLGFDCAENQKLFITGSFGGGPSCLGVFKDDNNNVKGFVIQKPNPSSYNGTVVKDYYCEVPSGATKIYIQTNKYLLQTPSCKLTENITYRKYSEIILQNETDIKRLQSDLDESIYKEQTIPQTWVKGIALSSPVIGEAPNFVSNSSYLYCYIEGLKPGDVVNAHFRAGTSLCKGAKLKNGVIVDETFFQNQTTLDRTYVVDDTFDAIILNNYRDYVPSPTAEVITSRISLIESNIDDLQKTVNDIIEQGIGGEFNLLCFGNSFTQDTISYIPWLIKECEPNLKLNVYFTYMGGMPISQCLAYISNGITIALNESGTPTTKYENHGGWDRIYSYSNGEWVEPDPSATNYHKSYVLYKYEDGANGWVSQSEPTAASVLQMKNWDLITIQQGGSINFGSWDYYFKPYIYKIQAELQKQVKHNFKLGYLMTHASYATTSESLLEHYNGIIQNSTKMLENTPIEIVMPYATALQNARTTYLDRFGAGGHLLGDIAHVSDGIGCLVCAYTNTMAILDLIGSKKSIVGSQIYPDAAWLRLHNIPAVSSTIEGLSKYNIWLAQQCAVMAIKYPLQLTNMIEKGMCGDTEIEMVLSNCTSSNFICSINAGESYMTTLIADDGYTINSVTVIMGGIDITSSAYNQTTNEINIENVSGKIEIIADAT